MEVVIQIVLYMVALKAIIIGSDFNFLLWYKYGKEYTEWYFQTGRKAFTPKLTGEVR